MSFSHGAGALRACFLTEAAPGWERSGEESDGCRHGAVVFFLCCGVHCHGTDLIFSRWLVPWKDFKKPDLVWLRKEQVWVLSSRRWNWRRGSILSGPFQMTRSHRSWSLCCCRARVKQAWQKGQVCGIRGSSEHQTKSGWCFVLGWLH